MKKSILAILLAMGLAFTACQSKPADNTNKPESTTEVKDSEKTTEGQEATSNVAEADPFAPGEKDAEQVSNTWYQEEPTTLNSAKGSDASSYNILLNVMEPLTRTVQNKDGGLDIEPAGAESWEVSEDGKTYTFKIRANKWSDGKEVTAHDYAFGLYAAADPSTGAGGMIWLVDCIEGVNEAMAGSLPGNQIGVKALDDKTLEIKLVENTPYFLQLTSTRPTFPIREDKFKEMGEKYGTEAGTILTNGPFNLDSWTHNTDLQLSKNPNYWDADKVSYEKVNWRIMEDENTRMNAFLNGEIDSVSTNKAEWQQQFEAKENITKKVVPGNNLDYLFFNTNKKPYNNPKVRLAFSLALNREEAIQAVYNGVGEPGDGWVVKTITLDGKEFRSVVPSPLSALKEKYPDPKALLEEGLKEEGMDLATFEANLEFGGTSEKMKEIGDYFIASFTNTLGIKMNAKLNEWAAFSAQVGEGNFDIGYMAWMADYNDPYHMLSLLMSNVNGVMTGYKNEKYDKLVLEGKAAASAEEMLAKYQEAEALLMEEAPVVPILFPIVHRYGYSYLRGYSTNPFATQGLKYGYTSGK